MTAILNTQAPRLRGSQGVRGEEGRHCCVSTRVRLLFSSHELGGLFIVGWGCLFFSDGDLQPGFMLNISSYVAATHWMVDGRSLGDIRDLDDFPFWDV